MIPTKLIEKPWIEPNGKRGQLVFSTDIGLLSKEECARLLNIRPGTFYERYRRCYGSFKVMNNKLFTKLEETGPASCQG